MCLFVLKNSVLSTITEIKNEQPNRNFYSIAHSIYVSSTLILCFLRPTGYNILLYNVQKLSIVDGIYRLAC